MNEEEKKAIEYMKEFQKDLYGASSKNLMANYLDTIFNLIDKQQKEIEELKERQDYARLEKEQLLKNGISKDKIREKIKEYNEKYYIYEEDNAVEVLQELLEE